MSAKLASEDPNYPKRESGSPVPPRREKSRGSFARPYEAPEKKSIAFASPSVSWTPNKKFTDTYYNGE